MHGCPPDEIERIGRYLIEERHLHTAIKLNPTLLGPEELRYLLNEKLGYEITIPDEAFDHDLKYPEALNMINSLSTLADKNGVQFGLKLTNTLESLNSTNWLPPKEKMVYTSGRALHPLTINLARKLQNDFNGKLDISFSAGIDAFNVADTLACNLKPITVCSDLLKPGGYLRLTQYLEELKKHFLPASAKSIDEFISSRSNGIKNINEAGLHNLNKYASEVIENKNYHKSNFPYENIKTTRKLTEYDCIHAPCIEACAVDQNVLEYMYYVSKGDLSYAYKVVIEDNPQPNITGNVCDHFCQPKCTRINYDNPLLIRGIKRYIAENVDVKTKSNAKEKNGFKVAVIGGGPSGLSCAFFLALEGFEVNVYESKSFAGGMASGTIPTFRLSDEQVKNDIDLIKSVGVKIHFDQSVDEKMFNQLRAKNDFVYIAVGAKDSKKLQIEVENLPGVYDQLSFLSKVRNGKSFELGSNVAIIGGGLSAVDAARTAKRILPDNGSVTMLYRRTKKEMPVGDYEIKAMLDEGVKIVELTSPISISKGDDDLILECIKMKLGEEDESGRRKPEKINGSEFKLNFDSIITAIGQDIVLDFLPENKLQVNSDSFETQFENVFAGGDVLRGADSLINAIGDGKNAAMKILKRFKTKPKEKSYGEEKLSLSEFQMKQAYRKFGIALPEIELNERNGFELVNPVLTDEQANKEAERCLYCDDICNICVGVCPNFANVGFESAKIRIPVYKVYNNGNKKFKVTNHFEIEQEHQIFNIADFCNECGNCITFCPTSGSPFQTKPRFYLTEESFNNEEYGYLISKNQLKYKGEFGIESLSLKNEFVIYENDNIVVNFNKNNFDLVDIKFKNNKMEELILERASEMYYLFINMNNHTLLVV
jgi:putative selenate reductase